MTIEEVRAAAERLTGVTLPGLISPLAKDPNQFAIALNESTVSRLYPEPLGPDAILACMRRPEGWTITLMDGNLRSKASWTDTPDPRNELLAQLIRMILGGRFKAGAIKPTGSMYDQTHDVRKMYFETDVGPMVVHTRRLDPKTKETRVVLEVVERKLFLQTYWQDDHIILNSVREIPELPSEPVRPKLKAFSKAARDAGLFYSHAGIAIYHFPLQQLRTCVETHCEAVATPHAGRVTWRLRSARDIDTECLQLLLAVGHERAHFVQSMSTPFGTLEWRVLAAIVSTAGFLLRKINDSEAIARTAYLPLVDWYVSEGSESFRDSARLGPDSRRALKNTGIDSRKYLAALPGQMDLFFQELSKLIAFWKAVLGREVLTMREFVQLANDAFEVLALNSDLSEYPVWSAHDLELKSYLPEGAISTEEILEGDARLREHQELASAGTGVEDWQAWRSRVIAGTYAPAYEWLRQELSDTQACRAAIEVALTGPIDLVCRDAVKDGVIYVEDCLPGWRLQKAVAAMKTSGWPRERKQAESAARREIANRARIPSPSRVLFAMRGKELAGPRAWGTDAKIHGAPAGAMDYFEYRRKELVRGLEIRERDSLAFSWPERAEIFQPMMEVFSDTALLNIAPGSTPSLPLYVRALLSLFANKLLLEAFLGEGRVKELKSLEASFLSRLSEDRIAAETIAWPDLPAFAKGVLGPAISKLLQW